MCGVCVCVGGPVCGCVCVGGPVCGVCYAISVCRTMKSMRVAMTIR